MSSFQDANAAFTADAPSLTPTKPALAFIGAPRGRLRATTRQHHAADAAVRRGPFVGRRAEAAITGREENDSTVDLVAESGRAYYICQHVSPGLAGPRNRLELVTEAKGQSLLKRCTAPKKKARCFDHPECRAAKPE